MVLDTLAGIAGKQWDQLAEEGLLRADLDRQWAVLNTIVVNLGPREE